MKKLQVRRNLSVVGLLIFIASFAALAAEQKMPLRDEAKKMVPKMLAHLNAMSPEERVCKFEVSALTQTYFQNDDEIRSFAEKVAKCSAGNQTADDVYKNVKAQRPTKLSAAFQREYNEGSNNVINLINQYCNATNEIEKTNLQEKIIDLMLSSFNIESKKTTIHNENEKLIHSTTTVSRDGKVIEKVEDSWTESIE